MFVIPMHLGGLQPILNFNKFKYYMYISTFKIPNIKQVWQLIQKGDYVFSVDLKDADLHILLVKHHHLYL